MTGKEFVDTYKVPMIIIGALLGLSLLYAIIVRPKVKYSSSIEFGRKAANNELNTPA